MTRPRRYVAFHLLALILAAASLAGCGGGQLAGPEADQEAQTFAAKPDMARLYLIQGYVTGGKTTLASGEAVPGSSTVYYYKDPDYMSPLAIGVVTTLLGGPIAGIVAGSQAADDAEQVEKPKRKRRISFAYKFFVDDKYIGDIGSEQYMALDLPPGTHSISFEQPGGKSIVVPLTLQRGEIDFFLANASAYMGAYWEKCGQEDCAPLIRDGHRVTADLSGRPDPDQDNPYARETRDTPHSDN
jgi:predicted small lipoprotein YifL